MSEPVYLIAVGAFSSSMPRCWWLTSGTNG